MLIAVARSLRRASWTNLGPAVVVWKEFVLDGFVNSGPVPSRPTCGFISNFK